MPMPPSEHRRLYMKALVSDLKALHSLDTKTAKWVAELMVEWFETRAAKGMPIDLGFVRISGKKIQPKQYKYNLNSGKDEPIRVYMGESWKWVIKFNKLWMRRKKPRWSKPS